MAAIRDRDDDAPRPPAKKGLRKIAIRGPLRNVPTALESAMLKRNDGVVEVPYTTSQPTPDQLSYEWEQQKIAATEQVMYQGVRTPRLVAKLLSIEEDQAERYIRCVIARWQTLGDETDLRQQRGECLAYLDHLQNQLWVQIKKAKLKKGGESEVLSLNSQLLALFQQRQQLYGLNPQTIQQILSVGDTDSHHVLQAIKKQSAVRDVAAKFAAILKRNREAAEAQLKEQQGL